MLNDKDILINDLPVLLRPYKINMEKESFISKLVIRSSSYLSHIIVYGYIHFFPRKAGGEVSIQPPPANSTP